MNRTVSWKTEDIHKVNNFLIIKGNDFFDANNDPDYVYRACYSLPSSPEKMEDWISTHLDEKQAEELYEYIFSPVNTLST